MTMHEPPPEALIAILSGHRILVVEDSLAVASASEDMLRESLVGLLG
ncbi:MAG: hypothetical protein ABIT68_05125 [Sphingomicrobium sp.]